MNIKKYLSLIIGTFFFAGMSRPIVAQNMTYYRATVSTPTAYMTIFQRGEYRLGYSTANILAVLRGTEGVISIYRMDGSTGIVLSANNPSIFNFGISVSSLTFMDGSVLFSTSAVGWNGEASGNLNMNQYRIYNASDVIMSNNVYIRPYLPWEVPGLNVYDVLKVQKYSGSSDHMYFGTVLPSTWSHNLFSGIDTYTSPGLILQTTATVNRLNFTDGTWLASTSTISGGGTGMQNPSTGTLNMNTYGITGITTLTVGSSVAWTGGRVWYVPLGASIQDAINNASAGDTIELAAGTYTITSSVNLNKQVYLRGQGIDSTWIHTGSMAAMLVIQSSNVSISDLTLTNTNTACYGITYSGGPWSGIRISRVRISASDLTGFGYGIRITGAATISDCDISLRHSAAASDHLHGIYFAPNTKYNHTYNVARTRIVLYAMSRNSYGIISYQNNNVEETINIYDIDVFAHSDSSYGYGLEFFGAASGYAPRVNVYGGRVYGTSSALYGASGTTDPDHFRIYGTILYDNNLHTATQGYKSSGTIYTAQGRFYGPQTQIIIGTHTSSTNTLRIGTDHTVQSWIQNAQGSSIYFNSSGVNMRYTGTSGVWVQTGALYPSDATFDLGLPGYQWRHGYWSGNINVGGTLTVVSSMTWTGGRVWYVPLGASIQTVIDNASAGDVVEIAAGTYTVTSAINIHKPLTLRGQGRERTWVYSTNTTPLQFSSGPVTICDLAIHGNYSGSANVRGITPSIHNGYVRIERVSITLVGSTGEMYGLSIGGNNAMISDCHVQVEQPSAGSEILYGILVSDSSAADTTVDIMRTTVRVLSNNVYAMGIGSYRTQTTTTTVNLYDCDVYAQSIGGTPYGRAIDARGTNGNAPYVNVYGGRYYGYSQDIVGNSASTDKDKIRIYGAICYGPTNYQTTHGSTSSGTVIVGKVDAYGAVPYQVNVGTHIASTNTVRLFSDSVHSGGVINSKNNGMIMSSTGTMVYGGNSWLSVSNSETTIGGNLRLGGSAINLPNSQYINSSSSELYFSLPAGKNFRFATGGTNRLHIDGTTGVMSTPCDFRGVSGSENMSQWNQISAQTFTGLTRVTSPQIEASNLSGIYYLTARSTGIASYVPHQMYSTLSVGTPLSGSALSVSDGSLMVGFNETNKITVYNSAGSNYINGQGDSGNFGGIILQVNSDQKVLVSTWNIVFSSPIVISHTGGVTFADGTVLTSTSGIGSGGGWVGTATSNLDMNQYRIFNASDVIMLNNIYIRPYLPWEVAGLNLYDVLKLQKYSGSLDHMYFGTVLPSTWSHNLFSGMDTYTSPGLVLNTTVTVQRLNFPDGSYEVTALRSNNYWIEAGAWTPPSRNAATLYRHEYEYSGSSYAVFTLIFSSISDTESDLVWFADSRYDQSSDITMRLLYFTTATTTGNIQFQVVTSTVQNALTTVWTTTDLDLVGPSTNAYDIMQASYTYTANKPDPGTRWRIKIRRDADAAGDTSPLHAYVTGLDIQFKVLAQ